MSDIKGIIYIPGPTVTEICQVKVGENKYIFMKCKFQYFPKNGKECRIMHSAEIIPANDLMTEKMRENIIKNLCPQEYIPRPI